MKAVLGVDPGLRGGIALLHGDGRIGGVWSLGDCNAPWELVDTVRTVTRALRLAGGCQAYLEKVGYIPGDGGKGLATFMRLVGILEGAFLALGVEVIEVYPQLWQAKLECLSRGDKNVTKARAKALFPEYERMTHAVADALLIAAYGQQRAP